MAALTIVAADVVAGSGAAISRDKNAGAAVTAGQPVYLSSNKWYPAFNDTAAHAAADGIAMNSAAADQPLAVQTAGNVTVSAVLAVGKTYYVGPVAGDIIPETDLAPDKYVTALGTALSTTSLMLKIAKTNAQVAAG